MSDAKQDDIKGEVVTYKYLRPKRHLRAYAITKENTDIRGYCENGLPIPPRTLWIGYGNTDIEYLSSGARHVEGMLSAVSSDGFNPFSLPGGKVLDFGCGGGRMMRHLYKHALNTRIYGTDLSGDDVLWLKQYFSPPFVVFQNTTFPHLPFASGELSFVYCGSVFSHVDDLADTWLLELRRILSGSGRLYITIHDEHTLEFLRGKKHRLADQIRSDVAFQKYSGQYNMLVIDRGVWSQVFYDRKWLEGHLQNLGFDVLNVSPLSYGFQTGYVLRKSS